MGPSQSPLPLLVLSNSPTLDGAGLRTRASFPSPGSKSRHPFSPRLSKASSSRAARYLVGALATAAALRVALAPHSRCAKGGECTSWAAPDLAWLSFDKVAAGVPGLKLESTSSGPRAPIVGSRPRTPVVGSGLHAPTASSSGGGGGGAVGLNAETPAEVRLAFFLQLSEATLGHAPRLLRRLWEAENVYAVHIDAKADAGAVAQFERAIKVENPGYAKNVFFMPREVITYRGISMLLNLISAMQLLLDRDERWDFFINLSGSDYPLISPRHQRHLLSLADRSSNFLTFAPRQKWAENTGWRFKHVYVDEALAFANPDVNTTVVRLPSVNPLQTSHDFVYANAEAWMINSRAFVSYVVNSAAARKLLVAFSFSVESSEHYFATLVWNSRFNDTAVTDAMRQVFWHVGGVNVPTQHPFYADEQDGNGTFVRANEVFAAHHKFYSRKFKTPDSPLMDAIDARLENADHVQGAERAFTMFCSGVPQRRRQNNGTQYVFD